VGGLGGYDRGWTDPMRNIALPSPTAPDRRQVLRQATAVAGLLLASGLYPQAVRAAGPAARRGAFDAVALADVMKSLGLAMPVDSPLVTLAGPDIAENGAVVPFDLAGPAGTRQLMLLVDKNPNVLAAVFNLMPEVEANLSTRVKMAQTSTVYVVAVTAAGQVLYTAKEVKVTLGGCTG
jgi:sulfur-oxidizing protein SoxY